MSLRSEVIRIVNEILSNSKKISELPVAGSVNSADLIEIVQNGVSKSANASQVTSGASDHFKGAWDASSDTYPTGTILAGDEWYVSVEGDLDLTGVGIATVYPGALIKALVNTPGQTPGNWKVTQ